MKKLLIAAIVASLCTPVLAAQPAKKPVQSKKHSQQVQRAKPVHKGGEIKPLESYQHKQGFYQTTEMRPIPKAAVAEAGVDAGAAGATAGAAAGGAAAAGATAAVPAAGASLGLATPLVGSLTVGAAVGIGAAVVAVGAAVGNHGGGGHHSTSGTTGTTR